VARGFGSLRVSPRETEPRTVVERALEGENPRRAPTGGPGPGQVTGIVAERTPGGSKASKRACRPLTGEPNVGGKGTVRAARSRAEATGLTIAGNLRPGSCVLGPPPGGFFGQRAGADQGESGREAPADIASAAVETRTRKEARRPARAGTAPREGKALQGSSRDASGMKEGREASGATVNGRGRKASIRAACQPEPSRGARTLRTAPARVWRSSPHTSLRKEARVGEGRPT